MRVRCESCGKELETDRDEIALWLAGDSRYNGSLGIFYCKECYHKGDKGERGKKNINDIQK